MSNVWQNKFSWRSLQMSLQIRIGIHECSSKIKKISILNATHQCSERRVSSPWSLRSVKDSALPVIKSLGFDICCLLYRSGCGVNECLHRPPECEPSTYSPLTGVRIPTMQPNQYHNYNRYWPTTLPCTLAISKLWHSICCLFFHF